MRRRVIRAAATALVVGLLSGGIVGGAAHGADGMKMSGWLPYWLMKVLPSITDGTPARHMAAVLAETDKRSAFIGQITALVNDNGYDGIDLDFEKFAFNDGQQTWAATKSSWVTFVSELATSLHATGKLLSVSVPPMYSDSSGYWVYAFRDIAPHIDKLRIMAYDYSWDSAGPIGGPLSWVRTVLGYAVDAVPASKVYLGTRHLQFANLQLQ